MAKKIFLYENVYRDLKNKISSGSLRPGDKLDAEKKMENLYGVSAITVKKALSLLGEEGLIERVRGQGTFVSERTKKAEENGLAEKMISKADDVRNEECMPIVGAIFEHVSSSFGLQMLYEFEMKQERQAIISFRVFLMGNRTLKRRQFAIF